MILIIQRDLFRFKEILQELPKEFNNAEERKDWALQFDILIWLYAWIYMRQRKYVKAHEKIDEAVEVSKKLASSSYHSIAMKFRAVCYWRQLNFQKSASVIKTQFQK